jgi:hypothetical protein
MSQDLTVNIKTTSDVPVAMDRAKTATVSFSKQVEDIQKKFSTGFKDIFLGFFAPMVLLNAAISYFGNKIAEAQKIASDGFEKLADSSSRYGTAEEKTLAAQLKHKMDLIKADKELRAGKSEMFKTYMETTPEGKALVEREISKGGSGFQIGMKIPFMREKFVSGLAMMNQIQAEILDIEDRKISPEQRIQRQREIEAASKAEFDAANEKTRLEDEKKAMATRPKFGTEGYGNVIGVGSNIAIEMAQMQIDELRRHTELLQMIATKESVASVDFSKGDKPASSPSRAKLLSGK